MCDGGHVLLSDESITDQAAIIQRVVSPGECFFKLRANVLFWPSFRERLLSAMALAERGCAFNLYQYDHSDLLQGYHVSLQGLLGIPKEFQEAMFLAKGLKNFMGPRLNI